jgi:hypothetical protein
MRTATAVLPCCVCVRVCDVALFSHRAAATDTLRGGRPRTRTQIEVNGNNVHPVYQFLKTSKTGLLGLTRIKWNFEARPHLAISGLTLASVQKFLVDKQGIPYERYASITKPEAMEARKRATGEGAARVLS